MMTSLGIRGAKELVGFRQSIKGQGENKGDSRREGNGPGGVQGGDGQHRREEGTVRAGKGDHLLVKPSGKQSFRMT